MAKEETKNYVRSKIYTNGNHEVSAQNTVEALDKMIDDSDNVEQQVATLGSKVGEFGKVVLTENETDALYVTDRDGNVVTKTNKEGFFATAIKILKDGNLTDILELLKNVGVEGISSDFNDSLYITDSNGYVFFSITKNASGEYELNYVGKGSGGSVSSDTWLTGKNIFVLGDSLSTNGRWMQKIASLTGANFDESINWSGSGASSNLSEGGTATIPAGDNKGQGRARRLVKFAKEHPETSVDVIFYENINDMNLYKLIGDISDAPYFIHQEINVQDSGVVGVDNAILYFKENINTLLQGVERHKGTVVRVPYITTGTGIPSKVLSITKSATRDGDVTLNVNGKSYSISVTTSMTVKDIQDKIIEWDYSEAGCIDERDQDTVVFTNEDGSTPSLSIDAGGTGVNISVISSSVNKDYLTMYYKELTTDNFTEASSWARNWHGAFKMYAGYKGLIEYLQSNFPKALIIMVIAPRFSYDYVSGTSYRLADGTLDVYAWKQAQESADAVMKVQRDIAELYGLPVVDMWKEMGVNIINAYPEFYPNKNVHLTNAGYDRWGETIARILTGK